MRSTSKVLGEQKMMKPLLLLILALLTMVWTSAKPDESKKKDGMIPSGVVIKTLPNMSMGDDQESMDEDDTNHVNLMEIMAQCNESFIIQLSYIQALNDSGSFPDETDRTPKCYIRCVLEKTGVASEEGTFDPTRAAMIFGGERGGKPMIDVEVMATTCGYNRAEPCKCERSYQFMKCLMETEIQRYEKSA